MGKPPYKTLPPPDVCLDLVKIALRSCVFHPGGHYEIQLTVLLGEVIFPVRGGELSRGRLAPEYVLQCLHSHDGGFPSDSLETQATRLLKACGLPECELERAFDDLARRQDDIYPTLLMNDFLQYEKLGTLNGEDYAGQAVADWCRCHGGLQEKKEVAMLRMQRVWVRQFFKATGVETEDYHYLLSMQEYDCNEYPC